MKALIILLSLLIVLDVKADYSIETFLNYMQGTKYYDIIAQVKIYYGSDVAIYICMALVQSNDCETLVRTYISNGVRPDGGKVKTLESIFFNPDNYEIYGNNASEYHKILENIKEKHNIKN